MPEESAKIDAQTAAPHAVNPASLSIDEVSRLLSAAGGRRITPEQIQADIAAGAPVGPGGRIHLVHYAAWLIREAQAR
jgi:hypothetical protein